MVTKFGRVRKIYETIRKIASTAATITNGFTRRLFLRIREGRRREGSAGLLRPDPSLRRGGTDPPETRLGRAVCRGLS